MVAMQADSDSEPPVHYIGCTGGSYLPIGTIHNLLKFFEKRCLKTNNKL